MTITTPPVSPAGSDLRNQPDRALFELLRDADDGTRERVSTILVERYEYLVRWAVSRYSSRGEYRDDLTQVGFVGLVEAIQRFDPGRNVEFVSFARPTILGELRRHFRDTRRWVRPPRRIQELKMRIREATDELFQETGRQPTVVMLAERLSCDRDELEEALAADDAFSPLSLDAPLDDADGPATYLDLLGEDEPAFDDIVDSESLWPLLQQLPERERTVMLLRFYGNKTQTEIASRIGVSQMHVSRLLSRTLDELHNKLVA